MTFYFELFLSLQFFIPSSAFLFFPYNYFLLYLLQFFPSQSVILSSFLFIFL